MEKVVVAGKRVLRGYSDLGRDADLEMKFYGRGSVEISIYDGQTKQAMTLIVDRNRFMAEMLGQLTASELQDAHDDPSVAMKVYQNLQKGLSK